MGKQALLVLILMESICGFAQNQNQQTSFILKGKLYENNDSIPAGFVEIINESKQIGALSDENGNFRIKVNTGDTIVFISLEFLGKVVYVQESHKHSLIKLNMQRNNYAINEVKIYAWKSYEDFQDDLLELELDDEQMRELKRNVKDWTLQGVNEGLYKARENYVLNRGGVGVVAGLPLNIGEIKKAKSRNKVKKLRERQYIIEEKYNRYRVQELTQLEDEEVSNFMLFCAFDDDFLYNASQYEIDIKIIEKLEEYSQISITDSLDAS